MRRAAAPALLVAILLMAPLARGGMGPDRLADPRLEARALSLQRELRCVVCQGQSLDESNAPLAADLRRLIRTKLENGQSDTQITDYLVARYGDFILMKPPLEPETYLLWFGPLATVSIGIAIAGAAIVRARKKARAETPG